MTDNMTIKPFIKWAGGKGQLLEQIRDTYPVGLGTRYSKYAEPFVGGGAVLLDVLGKYDFDSVYISDINRELICTYSVIRDSVNSLIDALAVLQSEYVPLSDTDRKEYYYNRRAQFNEVKMANVIADRIECAALFIFLNRTCFNGLYRVNRKGEYNVPMGSYKNPMICDGKNLSAISKRLKNVQIVCGDYRESEDFVDDNTFVYFDPPYRPLTVTASFTAYSENIFDDKAQRELAAYVDHLSMKGAKVVVSNSDPKNTDTKDDFFDRLYSKLHINRVEAVRMINCNGDARGRISELLITN